MKTIQDVNVSPTALKKRVKNTVDPRYDSVNPPDKQTLDLRLATVIAFYPKVDKCRIRMRNSEKLIVANLSHDIISHSINVGFMPEGKEYKCNVTGYDAIKPYDIYTCTVLAIGGDFDHGGAVVLNFITMADTVFPDNPKAGSYLIQNQDAIIELNQDTISLNAEKILVNGQEIEKGEKGEDGYSPQLSEKKTWLKYNPETKQIEDTELLAEGTNGKDGIDGKNGLDGMDGRGINSVEKINSVGHIDNYKINYNKNPLETYFSITNGRDGTDGTNGIDGRNGTDGIDGIDGRGIVDIELFRMVSNQRTYKITYNKPPLESYFTVYDGIDGTNGYSIFTGGSSPVDSFGNIGDLYLNQDNYDLWYKYPYTWNLIGNIKGDVSKEDIREVIEGMDDLIATGLTEEAVRLLEDRFMQKSHPIGTVYQNGKVKTNPYDLFGVGTWQRITDRFLWSINDNDTPGMTGGNMNIALSTANMPQHTHIGNPHSHGPGGVYDSFMAMGGSSATAYLATGSSGYFTGGKGTTTVTSAATQTNQNTGSGSAFSIMPPYYGVYTWIRIL